MNLGIDSIHWCQIAPVLNKSSKLDKIKWEAEGLATKDELLARQKRMKNISQNRAIKLAATPVLPYRKTAFF